MSGDVTIMYFLIAPVKIWTHLIIQLNEKVCPNWYFIFTLLFLKEELVFSFIKRNVLAVHEIAKRLSRTICDSLLEASL